MKVLLMERERKYLLEKTNYEERREYERRHPFWKRAHSLYDDMIAFETNRENGAVRFLFIGRELLTLCLKGDIPLREVGFMENLWNDFCYVFNDLFHATEEPHSLCKEFNSLMDRACAEKLLRDIDSYFERRLKQKQ